VLSLHGVFVSVAESWDLQMSSANNDCL